MVQYILYNNDYVSDPTQATAFKLEMKFDHPNNLGTWSELKVNQLLFNSVRKAEGEKSGQDHYGEFLAYAQTLSVAGPWTDEQNASVMEFLRFDKPRTIYEVISFAQLINFNLDMLTVNTVKGFTPASEGFYQLNVQV